MAWFGILHNRGTIDCQSIANIICDAAGICKSTQTYKTVHNGKASSMSI